MKEKYNYLVTCSDVEECLRLAQMKFTSTEHELTLNKS